MIEKQVGENRAHALAAEGVERDRLMERVKRHEALTAPEFAASIQTMMEMLSDAWINGRVADVLWVKKEFDDSRKRRQWLDICREFAPDARVPSNAMSGELVHYEHPSGSLLVRLDRQRALPIHLQRVHPAASRLTGEEVQRAVDAYRPGAIEAFAGRLAASCGAWGYTSHEDARKAFRRLK